MAAEPSYASGISTAPLLGDTIGANLARTVARVAERDALVEHASGRRWTYRELAAEVDAVATAPTSCSSCCTRPACAP